MTPTTPNRLAREKSPYLLQHAHNPVDWYPWGEEAFARARAEDKPIFLSIGYSTCHWCHVMERESFEDDTVAAVMNQRFINIKVDREERPDVDQVYMAFVQGSTGGGGWPMSVFLTPQLQPFYGGTYFPPEGRHGRPGFISLLNHIANTWQTRKDDLRESGQKVIAALQQSIVPEGAPQLLDRNVLARAFQIFQQAFDRTVPGFGQAPKFPRPVVHDFLLRYFARTGNEEAAKMVVAVLGSMARGGIHDLLGGGFHRYSVDRNWHVPHFEKMLYDQAQLATSYLEAYQVWPEADIGGVARRICEYVIRDLTDGKTGGFYSAEDADSPLEHGSHERAEGAFYVYTQAELDRVLGDASPLFSYLYGCREGGNAEDPHGELTGKNVLHRMHTFGETATRFGKTEAELRAILDEARQKLLAYRNTRPRPHLDDKILTAWNGLMIAALARASVVLGEPAFLAAAERAADFIATRLLRASDGVLLRRFRDGEAAIEGYLDDYAMFVHGLLELYAADFDLRWLRLAERLTTTMIERFHDEAEGGFFATSGRDPSVLVRMKDDYDGAEPAGNSIATLDLARLGHLVDRPEWLALANKTIRFFSHRLATAPHALPEMLVAFDLLLDSPVQVVIAGEKDDPHTRELARAIHRRFVPRKLVLLADEKTRAELGDRLQFIADMRPIEGKSAAYVCREWRCERPTTDPAELERMLDGKRLAST